MRIFLWNLLLAIFWAAVSDTLTLLNLFFGFVAGYLVLFSARRTLGNRKYFRHSRLVLSFLVFFVRELVKSTFKIAHDIVTPTHRMCPGVVAIPLSVKSDIEITCLANLISLTPGTLSLDLSSDRSVLYVHAMYVTDRDVEKFRNTIKEQMERRVLELSR